jgi:hypothetical protein
MEEETENYPNTLDPTKQEKQRQSNSQPASIQREKTKQRKANHTASNNLLIKTQKSCRRALWMVPQEGRRPWGLLKSSNCSLSETQRSKQQQHSSNANRREREHREGMRIRVLQLGFRTS